MTSVANPDWTAQSEQAGGLGAVQPAARFPLDAFSRAPRRFGFSSTTTGGHLARSMMLPEITKLAKELSPSADLPEYSKAILDENVLGKPTASSREKSLRHLVQLYGLDPRLTLFRELRRFVGVDPESISLIAMICTYCRDPQLRASFEIIEQLSMGEQLTRDRMEEQLEASFPLRFSPAMKKSLAQNVNTTWTASGHLMGRARKRRSRPEPQVLASVYTMFAGYLSGLRGEVLLDSVFTRLVGGTPESISAHLSSPVARPFLRFRSAGGVVEFDFAPSLNDDELKVLNESN